MCVLHPPGEIPRLHHGTMSSSLQNDAGWARPIQDLGEHTGRMAHRGSIMVATAVGTAAVTAVEATTGVVVGVADATTGVVVGVAGATEAAARAAVLRAALRAVALRAMESAAAADTQGKAAAWERVVVVM